MCYTSDENYAKRQGVMSITGWQYGIYYGKVYGRGISGVSVLILGDA